MDPAPNAAHPAPGIPRGYSTLIGLLVVAAAIVFTLRSEQPLLSEWIGRDVTVQFRRDALGTANDLPISPQIDVINGTNTSIRGTLLSVSESGVVIRQSGSGSPEEISHWIPRHAILLVQLRP